jgi:UDP-N-acetylmuramoyl-tripeptide--D-alanyl-D-alanine ligase
VVGPRFDAGKIRLPLIRVDDPLTAAQQLSGHVREKYPRIKYVGITGSAGKTTTKEFCYQILSRRFPAFRSLKNWNNALGMPFSLLNMSGREEVAIFELAMSDPGIGEIDALANILLPDVAVVLNVYPVHLEFLKNLRNVARGKSEIMNYLSADGCAFISGDSLPLTRAVAAKKGRTVRFGWNPTRNQVVLREITRVRNESRMRISFFGIEETFTTPIVNRVQVENLMPAVLVAQYLGMKNFEIQEALKTLIPVEGRGVIRCVRGITVIDETYNSNPEALKKTLAWVNRDFGGRKIAVLGDMLELGEDETLFHRRAGHFLAGLNFACLIAVGPRARHIAEGARNSGFPQKAIECFDRSDEAGRYLKRKARKGDVFLFKGSRGIALEESVKELESE